VSEAQRIGKGGRPRSLRWMQRGSRVRTLETAVAVESPAAKGREPLADDSRPDTSRPRMIGSSGSRRRSARAGMLGGLLWALFPLGELPVVDLVLTPKGLLAYYSLGYLWATLLLLTGLHGLHGFHRRSYGWLGTVGFYVSFVALVLAFAGGALEMTKTATTNTVSIVAYWTVLMSFFILALGSALVGLAITEKVHDPPSYLGGLLLSIAVPLGFLFVFAAGAAWDFDFWVGLTVPYGAAWLLLGYALSKATSTVAQHSPTSGQYGRRRTIRWRRMLRG
jgi:uncharacterized protein with PQ loop repeat